MKILFTGGSSFTGYWFIRALAAAGHQVVAVFRKPAGGYEGVRGQRVAALGRLCQMVHDRSFGAPAFLETIESSPWDLCCHHAAEVANYKSLDFDFAAALSNNTRNLKLVLERLGRQGCQGLVLTGSVFEFGEGAGSQPLRAFSPYGLSKGLTSKAFEYFAAQLGMRLGKFVIPNPFGPYEEPRFTGYLVKSWFEGRTPAVSTPAYVRDNIHVSLLAQAYARFCGQMPNAAPFQRLGPSGYVETQGAFARRFAAEMQPRLGRPCPVELKTQTDFAEPMVRINTDVCAAALLGWDESAAWDELAQYYRAMNGR